MQHNEAFNSLIENFLTKHNEQTAHITGVKSSDSAKKESYTQLLTEISQLRGRPLLFPYVSSGLGRGPFIELLDGSIKLDFIGGIGPYILGHCHPEILKANLVSSLESTTMQGHLQVSEIYHKLLNKLVSIASKTSSLNHAWLCPSGSMANENALKIIRQKRKAARYILAFDNAFAGRTTMMAEVTANPAVREGLPQYNEVLRVPFLPNDKEKSLAILEQHWEDKKDDIACFIMELIPGDGGCLQASREFFVTLCEFCKKKGIAIWFDEIQTFARSGELFAFEKFGLGEFADVCTIGKSLQLSATLWTKEYNPKPGLVSGTFAGSCSSLHSALATLNILEQGYIGSNGKIMKIHNKWTQYLKQLEKESLASDIEGSGIMIGVTVLDGKSDTVKKVLSKAFEKGLICFSCGPDNRKRLRFLLPAILEQEHLELGFNILRESLLEVKNQ